MKERAYRRFTGHTGMGGSPVEGDCQAGMGNNKFSTHNSTTKYSEKVHDSAVVRVARNHRIHDNDRQKHN